MWRVGVGYRHELAAWVREHPVELECLEITAEHFFDDGEARLQQLAHHYPLYVHGLGLSLGTPGPLDEVTLQQFERVVQWAEPQWISEHVAFTRTAETDLGHLTPLIPNRQTLQIMADHVRQVADRCQKLMIMENITSYLKLKGELSEPDFLNQLCEMAECGLLLDVTNLLVNSRNHGFDPVHWLDQLNPAAIVQLHVVGYSQSGGRWRDYHAAPIQQDLFDLVEEVTRRAPVKAIIIERDHDFPDARELTGELRRLKQLAGAS